MTNTHGPRRGCTYENTNTCTRACVWTRACAHTHTHLPPPNTPIPYSLTKKRKGKFSECFKTVSSRWRPLRAASWHQLWLWLPAPLFGMAYAGLFFWIPCYCTHSFIPNLVDGDKQQPVLIPLKYLPPKSQLLSLTKMFSLGVQPPFRHSSMYFNTLPHTVRHFPGSTVLWGRANRRAGRSLFGLALWCLQEWKRAIFIKLRGSVLQDLPEAGLWPLNWFLCYWASIRTCYILQRSQELD